MKHTISEIESIKKEVILKLSAIIEDYPIERMCYEVGGSERITSIFRDDDGEMRAMFFDKLDKEHFSMKIKDFGFQSLVNLATHIILNEKRYGFSNQ